MPKTWICPQCGAQNGDERLFCANNPPPSSPLWCDPGVFKCHGQHPDYWTLTKDWPVRRKPIRNSFYY